MKSKHLLGKTFMAFQHLTPDHPSTLMAGTTYPHNPYTMCTPPSAKWNNWPFPCVQGLPCLHAFALAVPLLGRAPSFSLPGSLLSHLETQLKNWLSERSLLWSQPPPPSHTPIRYSLFYLWLWGVHTICDDICKMVSPPFSSIPTSTHPRTMSFLRSDKLLGLTQCWIRAGPLFT